jgi:hypothetical protein
MSWFSEDIFLPILISVSIFFLAVAFMSWFDKKELEKEQQEKERTLEERVKQLEEKLDTHTS